MAKNLDLPSQIAYFEGRLELNPRSRVFAPLADLYRRAGRLEDALRLLSEGLEKHPDYVSALVVLAKTHADAEYADAASQSWQRVLALDPDNLVALKNLAQDATERGDWLAAENHWERYVSLEPVDEYAEKQLLRARSKRRAEEEAERRRIQRQGGVAGTGTAAEPEEPETDPAAEVDSPAASAADPAEREVAVSSSAGREFRLKGLATRTLAELYLAQGYRDKAVAVLRDILARDPQREDVRNQLRELETGTPRGPAGAASSAGAPSSAGGRNADTAEESAAASRASAVTAGDSAGVRPRSDERDAEREQFASWIARIRRRQDERE